MTEITLFCEKSGMITKCQANGHAGFSEKGTDIVCSAVTVLMRTAMQLLAQNDGVILEADTTSRGNLAFNVKLNKDSSEMKQYLKCIGDFLRTGFSSLQKEYPENVQLRELTE